MNWTTVYSTTTGDGGIDDINGLSASGRYVRIYPYTTGTLGTPTKTYSYAYGDANWRDKLTSFDGKTITYDAIGNPLTYDGWTYTWEAGRQLASMVKEP